MLTMSPRQTVAEFEITPDNEMVSPKSRREHTTETVTYTILRSPPQEDPTTEVPINTDLRTFLRHAGKALVQNALVTTGGNKSKAAKRLGITRTALHEKSKRYGIPNHRREN